jgi:hypothetical protein
LRLEAKKKGVFILPFLTPRALRLEPSMPLAVTRAVLTGSVEMGFTPYLDLGFYIQ